MRGIVFAVIALGAAFVVPVACSSSSGGDGGAGSDDLGKPCHRSEECASGHCAPRIGETITETVAGVCTHPCAIPGDCLAGWACLANAGGTDLCACGASKEICDGKDNDCDGKVDDDPGGTCACTGTVCGDRCADLMSDPANCGGCGETCPPGAGCVQFGCTCPDAKTACAKDCVDIQTDPKNCGGCGIACGAGATCVAGACRCGAGGSGVVCTPTTSEQMGVTTFCGGDDRCHAEALLPATRFGVGDVLEIAVTTGQIVYTWDEHAKSVHTDDVSFFPKPVGGRVDVTAVEGTTPKLAADGPDFLYTRDAFITSPAAVIPCKGAVCGSALVNKPVRSPQISGGVAYWLDAKTLDVERCEIAGCDMKPELVATHADGATSGIVRVDASGAYVAYGSAFGRANAGAFEQLGFAASLQDFAVDATNIYVLVDDAVLRCAKTGCGGTPTTFAAASHPRFVRADGTRVYWSASDAGLWTCPAAGPCTSPARVMTMPGTSRAFADDADNLYFANATTILIVSK